MLGAVGGPGAVLGVPCSCVVHGRAGLHGRVCCASLLSGLGRCGVMAVVLYVAAVCVPMESNGCV